MSSEGAATIAVVEDDAAVRESVVFSLRREGHRVVEFGDGLAAWEELGEAPGALPVDVFVLDITMPRMDGLELCRRLRALDEAVPILFLTSRDEEFDRVLGLELGADDYLCKPFSMRELLARVKVVLRRLHLVRSAIPNEDAEMPIEVGALRLDLQRYETSWNSRPVPLTITEFQIVRALARRPGHVKSREQLMQEAYPHDQFKSDRTIDTHVKRLRRKFAEADPEFDELATVYGVGYRWREPGGRE